MFQPKLYLGVDGVILQPGMHEVEPTPCGAEFLRWAMVTFRVRWLTARCPYDRVHLPASDMRDIEVATGVPRRFLEKIPVVGFEETKSDAFIRLAMGSEWYWIEDDPALEDMEMLALLEIEHRLVVSCPIIDPTALRRAARTVAQRSGLKVPPSLATNA